MRLSCGFIWCSFVDKIDAILPLEHCFEVQAVAIGDVNLLPGRKQVCRSPTDTHTNS